MRLLTDKEKELNNKSIERLNRRNKWLKEYYIPKTKLELEEGLQISFDSTKEQYKQVLNDWHKELIRNEEQMKILNIQNTKGVPEKVNSIIK